MMTEKEIEIAAREYCRLAGTDPDQRLGHSAKPNADGTVNMTWHYSPRWMLVADSILSHHIMNESIRFAQENVKEDTRPRRSPLAGKLA